MRPLRKTTFILPQSSSFYPWVLAVKMISVLPPGSALNDGMNQLLMAAMAYDDTHHHILEDPVEWRDATTFGQLTIRVEELICEAT